MSCTCYIVPASALEKLAGELQVSAELRKSATDTASVSAEMRKLRSQAAALTAMAFTAGLPKTKLAATPSFAVYDCKHHQTLPGAPVPNPAKAKDASAKRAFNESKGVAAFYKQVFKRNSIDNRGMTIVSSVHYGTKYNNAMWNGSQMVYGDGDKQIFIDFTNGNDVIGHELTHGVTQHSLQLGYTNDAGGLNESLSDCFGSMYRQWEAGQDVNSADWLIGHDIMGPAAKQRGYIALRNMANPADPHVVSQQPTHYSQVTPGMDPHDSSGPPNLAFALACKAVGGKSWEKVGKVWYAVMTGSGPNPTMTMKAYADQTRKVAGQLFGSAPAVANAIDGAWRQVGL